MNKGTLWDRVMQNYVKPQQIRKGDRFLWNMPGAQLIPAMVYVEVLVPGENKSKIKVCKPCPIVPSLEEQELQVDNTQLFQEKDS